MQVQVKGAYCLRNEEENDLFEGILEERSFPGGTMIKNLSAPMQENQVQPPGGKIPWRREWQPTPVFLPGKFHGQRNLAGYSPGGSKELYMTE